MATVTSTVTRALRLIEGVLYDCEDGKPIRAVDMEEVFADRYVDPSQWTLVMPGVKVQATKNARAGTLEVKPQQLNATPYRRIMVKHDNGLYLVINGQRWKRT